MMNVRFLVIALLATILVSTPYYLFGQYSAIGWYDETDLPIPTMLLGLSEGNGFNFNVAGGSYLKYNFASSSQIWNIYALMNKLFNPIYAAAIFRIVGIFFTIIAFFLLLNSAKFKEKDKWRSNIIEISSILIATSCGYVYGWVLGGYGFLFATLYSLSYCAATCRLTLKSSVAAAVLGIVAASSYAGITVFVFTYPVLSFAIWILLGKNNFKTYAIISLIGGVFAASFGVNEILNLHVLSEFSSRAHLFVGISNQSAHFDLLVLMGEFLGDINSVWFGRYTSLMTYSLIVLTIVQRSKHVFFAVLKLISIIFVVYFLFAITKFNVYRVDQYLVFFYPLLAMVVLIGVTRIKNDNSGNFMFYVSVAFALFLCASVFYVYRNVSESFASAVDGDNWHTVDVIKEASGALAGDYRSYVITPYKPKPEYLQLSGIRTIDGMTPSFSKYRTIFWHLVVPEEPIKKFHTHRQTAFNLLINGTKARPSALEMVNVKYLISNKGGDGYRRFGNDEYYCQYGNFFCYIYNLLSANNAASGLQEAHGYFIRELTDPWPYVFLPKKISCSKYDPLTEDYANELRRISYGEILLGGGDSINSLTEYSGQEYPVKYELIQNGIRIFGYPGKVPLVVNQEYNAFMTVTCMSDGHRYDLERANLVMTMIRSGPSCDELLLSF